jgi:hypothetical protein
MCDGVNNEVGFDHSVVHSVFPVFSGPDKNALYSHQHQTAAASLVILGSSQESRVTL